MEVYSHNDYMRVIKKNELLVDAKTWVNLRNIKKHLIVHTISFHILKI